MSNHSLRLSVLFLGAGLLAVATAGMASESDARAVQQYQAQLSIALQGDAEGQYRVGEMHENGIGTARDPAMAYLWYNKSAKQGHPKAREKLAILEKNRTDNQEEQGRVEAAMRALQQSEQEAAKQRAVREKAAAEARVRQQAEDAARARSTAEAAARARVTPPAATPAPAAPPAAAPAPAATAAAKPVAPAEPAKAPAKSAGSGGKDEAEFSANPCKGPQAKFLSTCN